MSGLKAWVTAERLTLTYEDGVWRDGVALTAHGGRVTLRAKEEELTLTGAYVETVDAAFIPDRAIVLGVAARTTLAITGATSYGVGVAANTTQFGNLLEHRARLDQCRRHRSGRLLRRHQGARHRQRRQLHRPARCA